jgi:hypothetical protein
MTSVYKKADDVGAGWVLGVAPTACVAVFVRDLRRADSYATAIWCGVTFSTPFGYGT